MHTSKEYLSDPDTESSFKRKSAEDLLSGSGEVFGNSITQALTITSGVVGQASPQLPRRCPSPSPSPRKDKSQPSGSYTNGRREQSKSDTLLNVPYSLDKLDNTEDSFNKSYDSPKLQTSDNNKSSSSSSQQDVDRPKSVSKISERAKKKAWYSVLYPSYKSRSEDFKKLFKDVPDDERLIVDYSCAIQRDILVHGRLYVSQNYLCFYANIFRWETCLCVKWKDVTSVTKEKTARVIPNAILVCTKNEKHFLTSFTTRDKAYLILFRVWQNALMGKQMQPQEMWQWVHNCYGDELGLTSDDEDYIDPLEGKEDKIDISNIGKLQISSIENILDDKNFTDSHSDVLSSSNLSQSDNKIVVKEENNLRARPNRSNRIARDLSMQSQCDQLPTDMSDSSDSEQNKVSFINSAECTSMHEGRQLIHTILPITVDNLFTLLFTKSKFLLEFYTARKTTNMNFGEWEVAEDGRKVRTVSVTVAVTQAVGPKSAHVTQTQELRECSKPGELYSVDLEAVNSGIPYADSFYVTQHFCLQRTVDDHTVFSVHAQIKYKKSVWGVVKGFIEKNTWAGLEEFHTSLVRTLQSEFCIPPAKSKARRIRRGANSQQRPPEDEPRASIKQIPTKILADIKLREPIMEAKTKYEKLSLFVIFLLFGLIILNVVLYVKLYSLETRALEKERLPNFTVLKDPPKSHEEWIKILQQQEALHATEMMKWQKVLQTAVELLRKTERALTDLQFLIQIQRSPKPSSTASTTVITSTSTITPPLNSLQDDNINLKIENNFNSEF